MLNLFDYLTEKDNKLIENYIKTFGVREGYVGNEEYLSYWRDNNKKLFRLLGGNLIYKIPFEYKVDNVTLCGNMYTLNQKSRFYSLYKDKTYPYSEDATELMKEMEGASTSFSIKDICIYMRYIVDPDGLAENKTKVEFKIKLANKKNTLQISKDMKSMKAIQAILKYFDTFSKDAELMAAFEEYKKEYSMILNTTKMKCNMCFSIHPLDFMTMSDNNNRWTSCMNWAEQGCYHLGTVEMMNSNCVICVYLDSSDPFIFKHPEEGEDVEYYTWNNKKWRQLFYCTKEIIVGGKPYPYANDDFTLKALSVLRELAEKNWNQEYKFGPERYLDMIHIGSLYRMIINKEWIADKMTTKHNIIFDTKGMYNDMFNDNSTKYWCVRNKVKKNTIISYSGKAPCLCCMNDIIEYTDPYLHDEESYNNRYDNTSKVICEQCSRERTCYYCSDDTGTKKLFIYNGHKICENCWNNHIRVCPDCGQVFYNDEYGNSRENNIYVAHKEIDELEYYNTPTGSTDNDEATIYEDKKTPLMSTYFCCDDCRKRILNNKDNLLIKKVTRPYSGTEIKIHFLKEIRKVDDPFVINHMWKSLETTELPETST